MGTSFLFKVSIDRPQLGVRVYNIRAANDVAAREKAQSMYPDAKILSVVKA